MITALATGLPTARAATPAAASHPPDRPATRAAAVSAPSAQAQMPTPAPGPVATFTLRAALDAAWARQPEARALATRRDAADARRRSADAWTPEPPAIEAGLRTDRLHRNDGGREWEVGVAVPLWLPGERDGRRALGDAEAAVVEAQAAAARWRLAGTLRDAWWTLALAREEVAVARTRRDAARALADDVARRVRAGDLARVDSHQAEGEVAAAQAELARRESAVRQAASALRVLVGEDIDGVTRGDSPTAGLAEPSPAAEPEPAVDTVAPDHPALREPAARAESARRAEALATLQRRAHPELAIGTTRERGAAAEPWSQTVTVGVRVPLGRADARRATTAAARADRLEAEASLDLEHERLRGEAVAARAEVDAARAVAAAVDRRAQLARETRGFVDRAFRAGESGLPDRLRVDREAAEADREAARARLELARAVSRWRQALGLAPE